MYENEINFRKILKHDLVTNYGEYLKNYGTCRCHDVQMKLVGKTYDLWNAKELQEAFSSGMLEKCSEVVGNTAKIATRIILENGFQPKINE